MREGQLSDPGCARGSPTGERWGIREECVDVNDVAWSGTVYGKDPPLFLFNDQYTYHLIEPQPILLELDL